jgi:hypothetical protein
MCEKLPTYWRKLLAASPANFVELRQREVRRKSILGTSVNGRVPSSSPIHRRLVIFLSDGL